MNELSEFECRFSDLGLIVVIFVKSYTGGLLNFMEKIMTTTLSNVSIPAFQNVLGNLAHLIEKAQLDSKTRGFDSKVLVDFRLAPDMLPLKNQILIACDAAKLCVARISGLEAPKFPDSESSLEDLQSRIQKTLDWIKSVPTNALDGLEEKQITFPVGKEATKTMKALDYVSFWALPNVYFHVTTAYNILRHNGVQIGKRDYLVGSRDLV